MFSVTAVCNWAQKWNPGDDDTLLVVNLLSLLLHPLQDSDFDSTGGLLGATIGRVKQLSRGSQTKLLCYMLLFCCFVFFVLYWFIKLRWSADRVGWPVAFINPWHGVRGSSKKLDWHTWRRGRRKSQIFFIWFFFFSWSLRYAWFFFFFPQRPQTEQAEWGTNDVELSGRGRTVHIFSRHCSCPHCLQKTINTQDEKKKSSVVFLLGL